MKYQIKNRSTLETQVEVDINCQENDIEGTKLRLAVLEALKLKADLSGADLSGTNLSGTNLSGADLSEAKVSNRWKLTRG